LYQATGGNNIGPCDEEDMIRTDIFNHNTICQVLREIYFLTDSETIRYKCRIATTMAKNMAYKLKAYKDGTVHL
jgi:hypothetical protein